MSAKGYKGSPPLPAEALERIGKNLARLRREKSVHLTQTQVAAAVGTTFQYVSLLETGHREPSLRLLVRLAAFYEVPVSTLLAGV